MGMSFMGIIFMAIPADLHSLRLTISQLSNLFPFYQLVTRKLI